MSVSKKWFHNAEKESLQFGPLGINFFYEAFSGNVEAIPETAAQY